jgi:hypothetical protein
MRCRFFSPTDDGETGRYLRLLEAIDGFWRQFLRVSDQRAATWVAGLRLALEQAAPGLGLEWRALPNGQKLYILPVAGAAYTPLAELFVERAPARRDWAFACAREPLPLGQCLSQALRDFERDLSTARLRVGVGRGHALEIVVACEQFSGAGDEAGLEAAHGLLATALGDQLFERWVSAVSILSQPRSGPLRLVGDGAQRLPLCLEELVPSVHAAVRGVQAGLPEQPCHTHCETADWVLFDLTRPADAEGAEALPTDSSGSAPQSDLFTASSMRPEMLKWFLEGGEFASERFSRCQERFCYLKLRLPGDLGQRVQQRMELEEAIDRWLVPGRLGCVVGSGAGQDFQYIHLALTELEAALALLQRRFEAEQPMVRAKLFFCDSEWRQEWLQISAA